MDGKQPSFVRMFVRIGALKRFHFLKKKTAELPVSVEWDRRRSDRRPAGADDSANPRTGERRSNPPFTWETADFVVVEESAATPPPDRESN
jgi:hypothetical protein